MDEMLDIGAHDSPHKALKPDMDAIAEMYDKYVIGNFGTRILLLRPAHSMDEDIEGELESISLDQFKEFHTYHTAHYEALSYTWGPPFENQQLRDQLIKLCGAPFQVTGNLYDALKRLRLRHETRYLWVDAICINQSNINERNSQVAIMSKIYAYSQTVFIWLGEDSPSQDGHVTFTILEHVAKSHRTFKLAALLKESPECRTNSQLARLLEILPKDLSLGQSNVDVDHNELAYAYEAVKRFRSFFARRYFHRVWMIQEMFYARDAFLHCGEHSIGRGSFFDWLENMDVHTMDRDEDDSYDKDLRIFRHLELIELKGAQRWVGDVPGDLPRFLECILGFPNTECQDPRDRLYAMLSLNDRPWPGPNYSLPVSEIWVQFSNSCVEYGCCQALIYRSAIQLADEMQKSKRDELSPALPSWVPDWRQAVDHVSFWEDDGSMDGEQHFPILADYNRLVCSLAALGSIDTLDDDGVVHVTLHRTNGHDRKQGDTVRSRLLLRDPDRVKNLHSGDVLCHISTEASNGEVLIPVACNSFILGLRPLATQSGVHIIVPLHPEALHLQSNPGSQQPVIREWQRFCIA
jgi:hypothetical protein